jgi:hypothetical protein
MAWNRKIAANPVSTRVESMVGSGSYTELSFKNHGVKGYINLILL